MTKHQIDRRYFADARLAARIVDFAAMPSFIERAWFTLRAKSTSVAYAYRRGRRNCCGEITILTPVSILLKLTMQAIIGMAMAVALRRTYIIAAMGARLMMSGLVIPR